MLSRLLLLAIVAACTHSCYARTQQNYYVTANSRPVTHGVSLAPGQDICQGDFPEPVCHDHFDPMDNFSWQSVEARVFCPLNPNPNPNPPRSRMPPRPLLTRRSFWPIASPTPSADSGSMRSKASHRPPCRTPCNICSSATACRSSPSKTHRDKRAPSSPRSGAPTRPWATTT